MLAEEVVYRLVDFTNLFSEVHARIGKRSAFGRINILEHFLECAQTVGPKCIVSPKSNAHCRLYHLARARKFTTIRTTHREPIPHFVFYIDMQTVGYGHKP